jgi:hypothetical protein
MAEMLKGDVIMESGKRFLAVSRKSQWDTAG